MNIFYKALSMLGIEISEEKIKEAPTFKSEVEEICKKNGFPVDYHRIFLNWPQPGCFNDKGTVNPEVSKPLVAKQADQIADIVKQLAEKYNVNYEITGPHFEAGGVLTMHYFKLLGKPEEKVA